MRILLVSLLICGCILEGYEDDLGRPEKSGCTATKDCPTNALCTLGTCLGEGSPDGRFRLRLVSRSGSPVKSLDVSGITFGGSNYLDLGQITVETPKRITGTVRKASGERVPADVIAISNDEGVRGAPISASRYLQGNLPTFSLFLPTNSKTVLGTSRPLFFDLFAIPDDVENLPPYAVENLSVGEIETAFFLRLPAETELRRINGRVTYNVLDKVPASGMYVALYSKSGQRISTIATTDAEGTFELLRWAQSDTQQATMSIVDPTERLPKISTEITLEASLDSLNLGTLTFDTSGTVSTYDGVVNGDGPVSGASLSIFRTTETGFYKQHPEITDRSGVFRATLFPGAHWVQVLPPITSPLAIYRGQIDVKHSESIAISTTLAPTLKGSVLLDDTRPLVDASISVQLLRPDFGNALLNALPFSTDGRLRHAVTNQFGKFEMPIDPGVHEVTVTPARGSGMPQFMTQIQIPNRFDFEFEHVFTSPTSALLIAQFFDASERPLAGERIELWQTDTRTLIAMGETNSNGAVLLKVPTE